MRQASVAVDVDDEIYDGPGNAPAVVDGLFVEFYWEAVENKLKSWGGRVTDPKTGAETVVEGAGRSVCDDVPYIRITNPNDRTSVVERPIMAEDKKKYRELYRRFTDGEGSDGASGTPLSLIPGFSKAKCLEYLRNGRIKTAEQLLAINDAGLQLHGMNAYEDRERVRRYIDAGKGQARDAALQVQLDAKSAEMDSLKQQLKEALEQIADIKKAKGK